MNRVAVIGGGISGLSAAYFLSKAGLPCTLIEERPRLGGVIHTENVNGTLVEAGPDSFIAQKPWAMELIRELGLADYVIGSRDHARRTFVVRGGRLVPLPDGLQFFAPTKLRPILTSKLFGWKAKLSFATEYFRKASTTEKDRSVAEFVREHYGEEANRYLAQPMLAGVYGGSSEKLSVNSVLPMFVELERKYGSLTLGILVGRARRSGTESSGSLFLTLRKGLQQLIDALTERIEGTVERVSATAVGIEKTDGGFRVLLSEGEPMDVEQVIAAVPAYRAAELIGGLDSELVEKLGEIPYHSSITAALLYEKETFDHPLDGFGFLVPASEGRALAACTWVNTKFDHRAAADTVFVRGFVSADEAERRMGESDDALTGLAHGEVSGLMGFRAKPRTAKVHRWQRAMAQYEVGHRKRLDAIEGRVGNLSGLHLGGNGYTGIGIPDCIRRSREIVERIVAGARSA